MGFEPAFEFVVGALVDAFHDFFDEPFGGGDFEEGEAELGGDARGEGEDGQG